SASRRKRAARSSLESRPRARPRGAGLSALGPVAATREELLVLAVGEALPARREELTRSLVVLDHERLGEHFPEGSDAALDGSRVERGQVEVVRDHSPELSRALRVSDEQDAAPGGHGSAPPMRAVEERLHLTHGGLEADEDGARDDRVPDVDLLEAREVAHAL